MPKEEYDRRQNIAHLELGKHYAKAVAWLVSNPPPSDWTGTSLEYACLEMVIF